MTVKVLLRRKDNGVAVMTLAEGANPEEAVKKFKDSHPNEYIDYKIVEGELNLPDYNKRNEWKLDKNWNVVL